MSLEARAPGPGLVISEGVGPERIKVEDRPATSQEAVSFELLPPDQIDEKCHIDLDTGEAFLDYDYNRLTDKKEKKELISASMTIYETQDESSYRYNEMRYWGETRSITFQVFVPPTTFRELIDNIKNGTFPETISIDLPFFRTSDDKKAPIEYGSDDRLIWHNKEKENHKIPVEGVRFSYAIAKPRHDEKELYRKLPIQSSTDRIDELQTKLTEMLKYVRWIAVGTVALAIMIGFLFLKQRPLF